MTASRIDKDSPQLLALLAALVALGPLTVDMYLPAMPQMMVALDTDIAHMHLTLSAYLTGFAVFHLACGPLADRFGRRPVLLAGTFLFVVASIGCARASHVDELFWYRFLQGVGACVLPESSFIAKTQNYFWFHKIFSLKNKICQNVKIIFTFLTKMHT